MKIVVSSILALFLLLTLIGLGGYVALEARRGSRPTRVDLLQEVHGTGRFVLDVRNVEVQIQPGPGGHPIRVAGEFDAAVTEIVPDYSDSVDGGWTYRLRTRPAGLLQRIAHQGGAGNSIVVTLPRDVPLVLEGSIDGGQTRIELGGLWVTTTDLTLGDGDHRMSFSNPLRQPMTRLLLDSALGELTLVQLGNASPREVKIGKSVGDACVDLRGAWQADATIEVACGVASCDLHRPGDGDALVRMANAEPRMENPGLPVLEVRPTGILSENVEISDSLRDTEGTR